jgi:hypothetical protein
MPETGYSRAPKIAKGAFVQLLKDIVGVVPNIISFQYNPTKVNVRLEPWNPFATEPTSRGSQAPMVQPFDVRETFSGFTIELDATDDLEEGDPVAQLMGIEHRLAALRKLTQASEGLLGDLVASTTSLFSGAEAEAQRPTAAPVLLVLGPRLILPVRITSFSIDQTLFAPDFHPLHATVTMDLEVLTPDVFRCQSDITAGIAVAAYRFARLQEDAAAVLNVSNAGEAVRNILPF